MHVETTLTEDCAELMGHVAAWSERLLAIGSTSVSPRNRRQLCDGTAALWAALEKNPDALLALTAFVEFVPFNRARVRQASHDLKNAAIRKAQRG